MRRAHLVGLHLGRRRAERVQGHRLLARAHLHRRHRAHRGRHYVAGQGRAEGEGQGLADGALTALCGSLPCLLPAFAPRGGLLPALGAAADGAPALGWRMH